VEKQKAPEQAAKVRPSGRHKKGRDNELGNCSWECTWAVVVRKKKKKKKKKEGNSETTWEGMQRAVDAKPKPKPNVVFLHTMRW
jgi:hypothetical protein